MCIALDPRIDLVPDIPEYQRDFRYKVYALRSMCRVCAWMDGAMRLMDETDEKRQMDEMVGLMAGEVGVEPQEQILGVLLKNWVDGWMGG